MHSARVATFILPPPHQPSHCITLKQTTYTAAEMRNVPVQDAPSGPCAATRQHNVPQGNTQTHLRRAKKRKEEKGATRERPNQCTPAQTKRQHTQKHIHSRDGVYAISTSLPGFSARSGTLSLVHEIDLLRAAFSLFSSKLASRCLSSSSLSYSCTSRSMARQ